MWRNAGLAALAAAVLLCLGGLALYGIDRFQRPGPLMADAIVFVPRGIGLDGIAERLEAAGVVDDSLVFQLGVRLTGATRKLQAGEYQFPAGVSMRGAMEILQSGKIVVRRLTLAEGLTSKEAVALIGEAEALDGAIEAVPPEGSLLPETYHYVRGDTRPDLIVRMQRARDDLLAELWSQRLPELSLSSPDEAVILASIVEKETALPNERPLVASVFLNRLAKGMRLQSDPTVVYGLSEGLGALGRPLTRNDLLAETEYNTYVIDGLPPGPISNPGRASLAAVLNPVQTEYLYFVADGNGGHSFAKTLDEHNRNVAKWRKLQTQQQN